MKLVRTEGHAVTPSEATELCIHHLRLAFSFYEAFNLSSEGDTRSANYSNLMSEIKRQITDRGEGPWAEAAIRAFCDAAALYDES